MDIIKSLEILSNYNWKDVDEWTITEQLQMPIQEDRYAKQNLNYNHIENILIHVEYSILYKLYSSSCGLFMLKFMEYWNGHTLSHPITQVNNSFV